MTNYVTDITTYWAAFAAKNPIFESSVDHLLIQLNGIIEHMPKKYKYQAFLRTNYAFNCSQQRQNEE